MHHYSKYFPVRAEDDRLDVVSVLYAGLSGDPRRRLLTFEGEAWTAGRMAARVAALQQVLREQGIRAGDRVALMLGNSPSHIAFIYALILSGATWVPVNTKFKSAGIEYLLGHCKPRLIVADPEFAAEIESACLAQPGADLLFSPRLPAEGMPSTGLQRCGVQPESALCLIYTSGTTGAPKGVIFTHRMMRIASESALIVANVRDGDSLFLWEPLCHIGGAQMLLVPFLAQASLVVAEKFSASRFWQQIEQGGCTQLHYLGGILDILMRLPAQAQPAAHPLRLAWGAGVGISAWAATRDRLRIALRECYGMTEGASFATVNKTDTPGSIGKALPWLAVELLDDQDRPVPVGELGQIVVSSEIEGNFLPGYLDNPQATAQALRHGKLYTGDMARADAGGNLYFVGRRTESMRVRGENVSAWEIERVFLGYPDIAAVAAVGVESEIGEQEILLYVQWKYGAAALFEPLAAWAQNRLAVFQLPRFYRSIEHFDLTPSERIRKHLLPRDTSDAWDRQGLSKLA
jgi:crotonobetaine/carnitine-CoA ligase